MGHLQTEAIEASADREVKRVQEAHEIAVDTIQTHKWRYLNTTEPSTAEKIEAEGLERHGGSHLNLSGFLIACARVSYICYRSLLSSTRPCYAKSP